MNFPSNILLLGLVFIELIWTITDPRSFKEKVNQTLKLRSILYITFALVIFFVGFLNYKSLSWPVTDYDAQVIVLGLFLFFLGMILAIWAKFTMKKNWGVPSEHHIERQSGLVTNGSYSITRNPIYLGLILIILGFTLALRSYFIVLNIVSIWYFVKVAKKEEELLIKYFGNKYKDYKSKVPLFL